jgi:hypothetical protein
MQRHRRRANSRSRNNGLSDVVQGTHHASKGAIKATELSLSRKSKLINLTKNNLFTKFLLFTATLKFRLKFSELNTVVSRFIRQRLKVCKGFITEPTVIRKRLHIDFLSILIRVVLSLQLTVLCLKSRHYVLITTTEETTKETIAVIRAIENAQSKTCNTSTETSTSNTLRSKFSHN